MHRTNDGCCSRRSYLSKNNDDRISIYTFGILHNVCYDMGTLFYTYCNLFLVAFIISAYYVSLLVVLKSLCLTNSLIKLFLVRFMYFVHLILFINFIDLFMSSYLNCFCDILIGSYLFHCIIYNI